MKLKFAGFSRFCYHMFRLCRRLKVEPDTEAFIQKQNTIPFHDAWLSICVLTDIRTLLCEKPVTALMSFLSHSPGRCERHCRLCRNAEMDHVKYLWTQSWGCKLIKHSLLSYCYSYGDGKKHKQSAKKLMNFHVRDDLITERCTTAF